MNKGFFSLKGSVISLAKVALGNKTKIVFLVNRVFGLKFRNAKKFCFVSKCNFCSFYHSTFLALIHYLLDLVPKYCHTLLECKFNQKTLEIFKSTGILSIVDNNSENQCILDLNWKQKEKQDYIFFYNNDTKIPVNDFKSNCQRLLNPKGGLISEKFHFG